MRRGDTPSQKPWNGQSMRPMNPTSNNAYRGINRILLALSGRTDPRWMTYQQAQANQWQVRKGERGTQIVKLVEVAPKDAGQGAGAASANGGEKALGEAHRRSFVLRRYAVFNGEQIDGVPELEAQAARV